MSKESLFWRNLKLVTTVLAAQVAVGAGQRTNFSHGETSGALTGYSGLPGIGNSSNSDFLYSANPAALTPTGRDLFSHSPFSGAADFTAPDALASPLRIADIAAIVSGNQSKQQLDSALSALQQVAEAGKAEQASAANTPKSLALVPVTGKAKVQNSQIITGFQYAANQFISHIPQSYQKRFADLFSSIGSAVQSASKAGINLSEQLGITVSPGGQLMIGDGSPQLQSQVPGPGAITTAEQAAELRDFDAARSTTDASALVTRAPAPQPQSPLHETSPVPKPGGMTTAADAAELRRAEGPRDSREVIAGQGPEAIRAADAIVAANSAVAVRAQPQSPTLTYGPDLAAADANTHAKPAVNPGATPEPRPVPRNAAENATRAAASETVGSTLAASASAAALAAVAVEGNAIAGSRRAASVDVAAQSATTETELADRDAATLASVSVIPAPATQTPVGNQLDAVSVTATNPATPAAKAPTRTRKPLLSPDDTFAAYKISGGFDAKVTALTQLKSQLAGISDQGARAKKQLEVTEAENMLRKGRKTGGQYREHAAMAGETVPAKQPKQSTGTPSEPSPYETWLCEEAKKRYDFDNKPKDGSTDPEKKFAELSEEEQYKYTKQYVYDNRSAKLSEYHTSLSSAGNIQGTHDGNRGKSFTTSEGSVKFSVNLDGTLKTEVEGNLNAVVSVKRRNSDGTLSSECDMIEFKDGKMVGFHLNTDAPGTTSQLDVKQLEALKKELDTRVQAPAAPAVSASAAAAPAGAAPAGAAPASPQPAVRSAIAPGSGGHASGADGAAILASAAGAQQTQHATSAASRDAVTATPIPTRLASQSAPGRRTQPTAERLLSSAAAGAQQTQHATPLQQPGDRTQQQHVATQHAASAAAASAATTSTQQHAPARAENTATAAVSVASAQKLSRTFGQGTRADGPPFTAPKTPSSDAANPSVSVRMSR